MYLINNFYRIQNIYPDPTMPYNSIYTKVVLCLHFFNSYSLLVPLPMFIKVIYYKFSLVLYLPSSCQNYYLHFNQHTQSHKTTYACPYVNTYDIHIDILLHFLQRTVAGLESLKPLSPFLFIFLFTLEYICLIRSPFRLKIPLTGFDDLPGLLT